MSPPSSGVKNQAVWNHGFLLGLFSTMKMEAMFTSETSIDFQRAIQRYFPEEVIFTLVSAYKAARCHNPESHNPRSTTPP
jgi:hypothetical protein